MKSLKFFPPLPEMVLSGKKTISWRVNDEKSVAVGDQISLCFGGGPDRGKEFAKGEVIWVKETTFGNFTKEDREGHEEFSSEEELYATYSRYYNAQIMSETRVKVIKFRLLNH